MVAIESLHSFQRTHDGVMIHLQNGEWISYLPLPSGAQLARMGDIPYYPYWRLVFEPNRTIEVIYGRFKAPFGFKEVIDWYKTEMPKMGWVESEDGSYILQENSATLRFVHQQAHAESTVRILPPNDVDPTSSVSFLRVIKRPYLLDTEPTPDSQLHLPIAEEAVR
jgi:hypothetical protein